MLGGGVVAQSAEELRASLEEVERQRRVLGERRRELKERLAAASGERPPLPAGLVRDVVEALARLGGEARFSQLQAETKMEPAKLAAVLGRAMTRGRLVKVRWGLYRLPNA